MQKRIIIWWTIYLVVGTTLPTSDCYGQEQSSEINLTEDGAWCWFQDPRAVYIKGEHERTYSQWMTWDGTLQVGAFDHKTEKTKIHSIRENWDSDDHNVGAFLILPDNRLMIFYAQHNKTGIFCRTTINPEDISQWGDEVTICNTNFITYAHPVYLSEEKKFYVFWRGSTWKPTFSTSTDGKSWSDPTVLIQDIGKESRDIRPYTKITSDGISSIHIAFTDGHPAQEKQNSIYYLKYEKDQFFRADGTVIGNIQTLPVQHNQSDIIYDCTITGILSWVWDISLDEQGYPVVAYTRFPKTTDHHYHYARWNGTKWVDVQITSGGGWFPETPEGEKETEKYYSAGIALNPSNPSQLYLSRPINGVFEIEKWSTPDYGKTWSSQLLTEKSTYNNIRPVVPRGYPGSRDLVLWMSGTYIHYTKYRTGIKLHY